MKLAAFEIHASAPEDAIAFYTTGLGWTFREDSHDGHRFWHIECDQDGLTGRLIQRMGDKPEKGSAVAGGVLSFAVDDIDAASEKLREAGGIDALPKFHIAGEGWAAYFLDTDNNVFGIFEAERG